MMEIIGVERLLIYLTLKMSLLTGGGISINEQVVFNDDLNSGNVEIAFNMDVADKYLHQTLDKADADSTLSQVYLWVGRQCEESRRTLPGIPGISDVELSADEKAHRVRLRFHFSQLEGLNLAMQMIYKSPTNYVSRKNDTLSFGGGNVIVASELQQELDEEFEPEELTNDVVTGTAEKLIAYWMATAEDNTYSQHLTLPTKRFELEDALYDHGKKRCKTAKMHYTFTDFKIIEPNEAPGLGFRLTLK